MIRRWVNQVRLEWVLRRGQEKLKRQAFVQQLKGILRTRNAQPDTVWPDESILNRLSHEEQTIVREIRLRTEKANRNNITRTEAYLEFYKNHPKVHWAFLAHVVSRNGGWSMTDVKGEWFTRVRETVCPHAFFSFLERANWLIFKDAYPQLLLYEKSKMMRRSLTHLLPAFGVSRFMTPIWDDFYEANDSVLLTRALIINEQNFIEQRIIQNSQYEAQVLHTLEFQVQQVLGLSDVLMPFQNEMGALRFAGATVKHFGVVEERIEIGKRLYRLLFGDKDTHARILLWMMKVRHTASRADYWPELFTPSYHGEGRRGGGPHVYSPRLVDVWPDVHHKEAEPGDWFQDERHLIYLFSEDPISPVDYTNTYLDAVQRIQEAVQAKEKLLGEPNASNRS